MAFVGPSEVPPDTSLPCPSPISAWTGTIGDLVITRGVDVDGNGDIVLCGYFNSDAADLDPTDGVDRRTAIGATPDVYVVKVRADGSYAWGYTAGSPARSNVANGIAIDPLGRIVAGGTFGQTVDFDPTEETDEHTSVGEYSAFVTWLAGDGTYLSTVTFGGPGDVQLRGVAVDREGAVLVVGLFYYEIDFDPGPGVDWRWGVGDIFISKLGPDGTQQWTHTIGGPAYDAAEHVTVDSQDNIYVTGIFRGTVDFDPSDGQDEHGVVGYPDIFVTKFHGDGSYAWTRTYNASYRASDDMLTVAHDGGCILTGMFDGTVDFDPTEGVDERTVTPGPDPYEETDIFLTKINSDGSYAWTYTLGGPNLDAGRAVAVSEDGAVFLAAEYRETVDFDPGPSVDLHVADAVSDGSVTKMQPDLSYGWTRTVNGSQNELVQHLEADQQGALYVVGRFTAPYVDFQVGCEVDVHDPHVLWSTDTFITKFVCPDLSADFDGDGVVDLRDAAHFQMCFTDEGPTTCGDGCSRLDLHPDDDIDLDDFFEFQSLLTGP